MQVANPVIGRIARERGLLEDGGREQTLQRFDGGARAADVHVERAVWLRIDVDRNDLPTPAEVEHAIRGLSSRAVTVVSRASAGRG